jgi:hypothetical protein
MGRALGIALLKSQQRHAAMSGWSVHAIDGTCDARAFDAACEISIDECPCAKVDLPAGDHAIMGAIVTGLRKAEKTRFEPYGTYAFALERDLLSNPRVLIVGYGGSDLYVDYQIMRARRYHGAAWRSATVSLGLLHDSKLSLLLRILGSFDELDASGKRVRDLKEALQELSLNGHGYLGPNTFVDTTGWHPLDPDQLKRLVDSLA